MLGTYLPLYTNRNRILMTFDLKRSSEGHNDFSKNECWLCYVM